MKRTFIFFMCFIYIMCLIGCDGNKEFNPINISENAESKEIKGENNVVQILAPTNQQNIDNPVISGYIDMLIFEEQIKEDYLRYAHSHGEKELTIDDVQILKNYGQYDDTIIVRMNRGSYQVITYISLLEIGVNLQFSDSNTPLVYKNGSFYELDDSYNKGIITKNSLLLFQNQINKIKGESAILEEEQEENNENIDCELSTLSNKIKEMTRVDFVEFFKEYNIFEYRGYAFIEYKNDICVAVMFDDDYNSINANECFVYKKTILNDDLISQIKIGMSPMDVVKLIGIPKLSATFGLSSLDFCVNDTIIRVFLASPNYIYDVRILTNS